MFQTQLIAHRGASAYAPENTMSAFEKARALGCRFVEFDVRLSADGEAFVIHDDVLRRTTNGQGQVSLVSADELKTLDAGLWFSKRFSQEPIPTLTIVLEWLIASGVQANIELKPSPGKTEETVTAVLTQLNRIWPHDQALPLLSSFDPKALSLCRTISPEIPIGLLMDQWQDNWLQRAKNLMCYSVHVNQRNLTKARVAQIKNQGYQLFVYTVNRKRQAVQLLGWGVDAIFSDYPDLLF